MAKSRKKTSVPKRIAGVKVPKPLRKGLKSFAANQNGRVVLGEALMAAAAAVAATQAKQGSTLRKQAAKAAPKLKAAGERAGQHASDAGAALGMAFEAGLAMFTDTLRTGGASGRPGPDPSPPSH